MGFGVYIGDEGGRHGLTTLKAAASPCPGRRALPPLIGQAGAALRKSFCSSPTRATAPPHLTTPPNRHHTVLTPPHRCLTHQHHAPDHHPIPSILYCPSLHSNFLYSNPFLRKGLPQEDASKEVRPAGEDPLGSSRKLPQVRHCRSCQRRKVDSVPGHHQVLPR